MHRKLKNQTTIPSNNSKYSEEMIEKTPNCIVGGFVKGYIWSGVRSMFGDELVGFIHTHPHPHGIWDNTSNADDFIVYLPGISRGSVYDTNGVVIEYDRLVSYDPAGNFYSSGSSNFWGALWLMINNGHG
jgi:hypothetical protein